MLPSLQCWKQQQHRTDDIHVVFCVSLSPSSSSSSHFDMFYFFCTTWCWVVVGTSATCEEHEFVNLRCVVQTEQNGTRRDETRRLHISSNHCFQLNTFCTSVWTWIYFIFNFSCSDKVPPRRSVSLELNLKYVQLFNLRYIGVQLVLTTTTSRLHLFHIQPCW